MIAAVRSALAIRLELSMVNIATKTPVNAAKAVMTRAQVLASLVMEAASTDEWMARRACIPDDVEALAVGATRATAVASTTIQRTVLRAHFAGVKL